MKKGDLIANINNSPESIAHAQSMGFILVDRVEKPEVKQPVKPTAPDAKQPTGTPSAL